jgi:hypothetical protein
MFLGSETARLAEMAQAHRMLLERALNTSASSSSAVISLGSDVAAHVSSTAALREDNGVLDRMVTAELDGEHSRLAEDLCLLETLNEANPGSGDVETLTSALLNRIQNLLEREQRMLYQPLLRLATRLVINQD